MSTDDPSTDPLSHLPIPPLTFSDDFQFLDDEGFDITFDDFTLPDDTQQFLNSSLNGSGFLDLSSSDPEFNGFVSDREIDGNNNNNYGSDICGYLNIPSPDDNNEEIMSNNNNSNNNNKSVKSSVRVLDNSSPESRHPLSSQGSAGSEADMSCPSPESGNSVVNQKIKREMMSNNNNNSNGNSNINKNDDDDDKDRNINNNVVLKRKNESYDVNSNSECRTNKYRRSNETSTLTDDDESNPIDEKKRARLIRNRESAQLSRQRKKHYVEELEDKVRAMHATIQDLNARISYFAAENANLKQQMVTGGPGGGGGVCSGPVMYPPHPAMAPVGYPWMPCPPYVVKPQGSQVPLVPIPRLKPQQPASSQKSKKTEVKKPVEGVSKSKGKTKKVASISFIGLLLFILLFGGLVPLMNVKLSGVVTSGVYSGNKSSDYKVYNHGRVLMGDEYDHLNRTKSTNGNGNASEPLVASLYVPRNDKLVKIDGNLIIHSVLASEKAMASREEQEERIDDKDDDGVTGSSDLVPAISIPAVNRNMYRTSSDHQRALSSDKKSKSKHADGKLQQWFREGLAGPMLSSGMCTEVFQFDVSAAIVPATSAVNITATDNHHNSTYTPTMKNRRILHGLPIPLSATTTNITKEKVAAAAEPGSHDSDHHEPHYKNNSASSMVVSVLFDPREAGDGADVEGMMGAKGKSFSRIFVVVLLDSVKYVTYSCMLPLKGASHLVTA